MPRIGDIIHIYHMIDEPEYTGAEGIITHIDDAGQLHGTWGGLALVPEVDEFQVIPHFSAEKGD